MFTYSKEERLRSKTIINRLFAEGKHFYVPPFRVVWLTESFDSPFPVKLLIGVPRKKVRKAVQRNRIKRRIREAYRLNKNGFYQFLSERNRSCSLAILYNASDVAEYKEIEEKIILILKRLEGEYEKADR